MKTTMNQNVSRWDRWGESRRAEERGDYIQALEIHKQVLREEQASYAASLRAGWLYYKLGEFESSLQYYERACALSNDDWAFYGIMNCLTSIGDTDTLAVVAETVYGPGKAFAHS